MKTVVISLKTQSERRKHILCEFGKQDVSFAFFDAITPHDVEAVSKELKIDLLNSRLSDNERACFLSHVYLWNQLACSGDQYLTIFEDDVLLGVEPNTHLKSISWATEAVGSFDAIKLETFSEKVHLGKHIFPINHTQRKLVRLKSCHTGMAGYVISKAGASTMLKFIQGLEGKDICAIDHLLFDLLLTKLTVFQLTPALSIQADRVNPTMLPSQLEANRWDKQKHKPKKTALESIQRFFKRMYRSIGKRTFFKVVEFK